MSAIKEKKVPTVSVRHVDGHIAVKVVGHDEFRLALGECHADVIGRAVVHGMCARILDSTAMGKDATPEAKYAAARAIVDHYASGSAEWALASKGGFGPSRHDTLEAIIYVYGVDASTAQDMVKRLAVKRGIEEAEALKVFASADKIATRLAEVRANRATKVNADSLLDECMD